VIAADTRHKLANVPVPSPNPVRILLVQNETSDTVHHLWLQKTQNVSNAEFASIFT
jgi:hypothetical protein